MVYTTQRPVFTKILEVIGLNAVAAFLLERVITPGFVGRDGRNVILLVSIYGPNRTRTALYGLNVWKATK